MFPLSHIYISTEVVGRQSDLLVFGSVLPDISTTSQNELGRDEMHRSLLKFFEFVKSRCPSLLDLAMGIRLHSSVGKGADFYSDDGEVGFAKIEGRKIIPEVSKLLGIKDQKTALYIAHNFIEAAVDLNLLKSHPHLSKDYRHSVKSCDLQKVADCLSKYLKKDKELVLKEIKKFINFLNPNHLLSRETLVKKIAIPLTELRFGKTANFRETLAVTQKAVSLTRQTYLNFLDNAVEKMKGDFADLILS